MRSFSCHYFCRNLQGGGDVCAETVQCFETFFDGWKVGGEAEWGKEFWLEAIPDLEWRVSCGAVGSDVVGEFGKGE